MKYIGQVLGAIVIAALVTVLIIAALVGIVKLTELTLDNATQHTCKEVTHEQEN